MKYTRFLLLAAIFAAGFLTSHLARPVARPSRTPQPDPPTISTIFVRGPSDSPGILHKFSTETPAKPGEVAAWWVGTDGKTVAAGYVLTAVNPDRQ